MGCFSEITLNSTFLPLLLILLTIKRCPRHSASFSETMHFQTWSFTFSVISASVPSWMSSPFFMIKMRSAIYSISDTIWVDSKTILSFPKELMILRKRTLSFGSSPAVGSSKTRISGLFKSVWAMPILRSIPPEKVFSFFLRTFFNSTIVRSSSIRFSASSFGNAFKAAIYLRKRSAVKSG